jgi:hypothetical protein
MNGETPGFSEMLKTDHFPLLLDAFRFYSVEEKAEKFLNGFVEKCHAELDKLQNLKLRLCLYGVMGKVFKV